VAASINAQEKLQVSIINTSWRILCLMSHFYPRRGIARSGKPPSLTALRDHSMAGAGFAT
jgi:hypothetical protein